MKTMKYGTKILAIIIFSVIVASCEDIFHDLVPSDGNSITDFRVEPAENWGSIECMDRKDIRIGSNKIELEWKNELNPMPNTSLMIKTLNVSDDASYVIVTPEYMEKAFGAKAPIAEMIEAIKAVNPVAPDALTSLLNEYIKKYGWYKGKDKKRDKPVEFFDPVFILVKSGEGTVRRYTTSLIVKVTLNSNYSSDDFDFKSQPKQVSTTVKYGEPIGSLIEDPDRTGFNFDRTGFNFDGWDNFNPWEFVVKPINLNAKWSIKKYTVNFSVMPDGLKPDGLPSNKKDIEHKKTVTLPATLSVSNYNFLGWYDDSGTRLATPNTLNIEITSDTEVVAKFVGKSCTVVFHVDGGTRLDSITVEYGSKLRFPRITRNGYTFAGWFPESSRDSNRLDADSKTEFTVEDPNVKDGIMNLYALWEPVLPSRE